MSGLCPAAWSARHAGVWRAHALSKRIEACRGARSSASNELVHALRRERVRDRVERLGQRSQLGVDRCPFRVVRRKTWRPEGNGFGLEGFVESPSVDDVAWGYRLLWIGGRSIFHLRHRISPPQRFDVPVEVERCVALVQSALELISAERNQRLSFPKTGEQPASSPYPRR